MISPIINLQRTLISLLSRFITTNEKNIMETEFIIATLFNLGVNLLYTVIALIIAVAALAWVDRKLLKDVDIQKQLQNGNLAVALFASTVLLFVALIVSFGLKG